MTFIAPAFAQTEPDVDPDELGAPAGAAEPHESTEAHGGEAHGAFPPFDPATFGPQLVWLAISFGLLYLLMSRLALPRIGGILEARSGRIAGDLGEAGRLKSETDAAIAAYEQALAQARQNAHAIAREASDAAKAEIGRDRGRIEGDLQKRLEEAEARIGVVKSSALEQVDAIARDAAEAMVETLIGAGIGKAEIESAVKTALAERS